MQRACTGELSLVSKDGGQIRQRTPQPTPVGTRPTQLDGPLRIRACSHIVAAQLRQIDRPAQSTQAERVIVHLGLERTVEPVQALGQIDPGRPRSDAAQRRGEGAHRPHPGRRRSVELPAGSRLPGSTVRATGAAPRPDRARSLREREEPSSVSTARVVSTSRCLQPLRRVVPHGLEHQQPRLSARRVLAPNEALVE